LALGILDTKLAIVDKQVVDSVVEASFGLEKIVITVASFAVFIGIKVIGRLISSNCTIVIRLLNIIQSSLKPILDRSRENLDKELVPGLLC